MPIEATPAAAPPAPAAPATPPKAEQKPTIDPSILALVKDETPAAPATPAATAAETKTPAAETTPAADAAAKGEQKPADAAGETKPTEGTPDKVVQQLQQDAATTARKIDQLLEKVEAGEKLSAKEAHQLQAAKRKLDEIQQMAKDKKFNVLDHDSMLIDALSELDQSGSATAAEVKELRKTVNELQAEKAFDGYAQEYPGVNVRDLWNKAQADAATYKRFGEEAFAARASELFFERAEAASRSVAAKQKKDPPAPATTTAAPAAPKPADPPPVAPRVIVPSLGIGTSPAPTSDAAYLDRARSLVVDD